ncbi:MAG: hypothetical protein HY049_11825 [Acidobacteria bacterium]|nr:hypothetical protein [Acidobacteriota bacterium]
MRTTTYLGRLARRAGALGILASALWLPASAGTITFTLDPPALESLLRAVTPYEVVVGKHGLSETLTLSNPREVRFVNGGVQLKLDYRGTPLPIEDVLEVSLSLTWNDIKKSYEARIASLPLKLPAFGTIDLADHLRPFSIPSVFSEVAGEGSAQMGIEGKILSLKVLDTMIQASADVTFRKAPPVAPTSPGPRTSR